MMRNIRKSRIIIGFVLVLMVSILIGCTESIVTEDNENDLIEVQELNVTSEDATLRVDLVYKVRRTEEITSTNFTRSTAS